MRTTFTILSFVALCTLTCSAQDPPQRITDAPPDPVKLDLDEFGDPKKGDYGLSERLALIVGIGMSNALDPIYRNPVVDRASGSVKIEEASTVRPNVSLGISFTPKIVNRKRNIWIPGEDGKTDTLHLYDYYPKGISFVTFINPVSLTDNATNQIGSTVDLGLGIGWRAGPFAAYATLEAFSLNQPRAFVIDEYKGNDKQYVVNDELQTSMDPNDSALFDKTTFLAVGFKLAYTFDLVKSFSNTLQADAPK